MAPKTPKPTELKRGLEENQRIVQECEAKFARLVAKHSEGFRAPEVLAKALDLAVVYLSLGKKGLVEDVKKMKVLLKYKDNRNALFPFLLKESNGR